MSSASFPIFFAPLTTAFELVVLSCRQLYKCLLLIFFFEANYKENSYN